MMIILLRLAGLFTLVLGVIHIFLPGFLGYRHFVTAPERRELPFVFVRHTTTPRDLMGIIWVMNHGVSYTLLTIGVVDLFFPQVVVTFPIVAFWLVGWWFLRAVNQFYMGRRRGDILIAAWFAALGVLHLVVGVRAALGSAALR